MTTRSIRGRTLAMMCFGALAACSDAPAGSDLASGVAPLEGGQLETGYKAVVAIYNDGLFDCTGSLVSENMVLTARHCVRSPASRMQVKFGSSPSDFTAATVSSTISHPTADLALLRLPTADTGRVPLPIGAKANPTAGQVCTAVAFGDHKNQDGSVTFAVKRSGSQTVTSYGLTPAGEFAVTWGNSFPAPGDSGGPLICNGIVTGVVTARSSLRSDINFYTYLDHQWIINAASDESTEPTISATSRSAQRIDLFAHGLDWQLVYKSWSGVRWWPSEGGEFDDMGGWIVGTPEVVSRDQNLFDIFVRGTDLHVYYKALGPNGWAPDRYGYYDMGGPVGSHVSAVWRGNTELDLFALGTGGGILHKSWTAWNGWSPPQLDAWESVAAGDFTNVKAVVSGPDRIDLFMNDGSTMYHKKLVGTTWTPSGTVGYDRLGGPVKGNISAVSWGSGRVDLVVKDPDNHILHKALVGDTFYPSLTGWESHGGVGVASPVIISRAPNSLDIFVQGTNGALHHQWWTGYTWLPGGTDWANLGGILSGTPSVTSWSPDRIDAFVMGTPTMEVFHKSWFAGLGWTGEWIPMNGSLAWYGFALQ